MGPVAGIRAVAIELRRPGESDLSPWALWLIGRTALTIGIVVTNVVGACAVVFIALFVAPLPTIHHTGHVRLVNTIYAAGYVALAVPVGIVVGTRRLLALRDWLKSGREATPLEQRLVLRAPLRLSAIQLALWFAAAVMFGVVNGTYSGALGLRVASIVALTGLMTAACAYLLAERILRPAAVRALQHAPVERLRAGGVATRALLAWGFGTALPVLGMGSIGINVLAGDRPSRTTLAVAIVVLSGVAVAVGLLAVGMAARATADPIDSVRRALAEVQRGNLDVVVPVYDGTQVGQLQAGFNQMVEGLAERERIREAFGTYVDPEVAEHILSEGTSLTGEEVEVTIMFIDVRSFTSFAERTPAPDVVAAINRLFGRIVPVIHEHHGRVDKFVGDGLMAVFGAPRRLDSHADCALKAALAIERAVRGGEAGELEIGIGLNSGSVVAGNVGAPGRLEFSVIGDPVNVAARVESATRQTGDTILVSENTLRLLAGTDEVQFEERTGVELKGKAERVAVYAPVAAADRV